MRLEPTQLQHFADEIGRSCRRLAPIDLADVPLYIGWQSQTPARTAGGGAAACFGANLDMFLRPTLPKGRWRGRGFGILLNDRVIQEEAARYAKNCRLSEDRGFRDLAAAIAWHELAHAIESGPPPQQEPTPAKLAAFSDEVYLRLAEEVPAANNKGEWSGHGAKWLRICCHLHSRAQAAGLWPANLGYCAIVDGTHYGLSDLLLYRLALSWELCGSWHKSFAEILSTPPPEEFLEIWRQDTKKRSLK